MRGTSQVETRRHAVPFRGAALLVAFALAIAAIWAAGTGGADAAGTGSADRPRIALVIGNSEYGSQARLKNPVNDAELIASTLTDLGFDVELKLDVGYRDMKRAIKNLGRRLEVAGSDAVGLFFFAGHGVQVGGQNFLIPADAKIEREGDVEIEGVDASWVVSQMEYSPATLNFVILDACRDNPYLSSTRSAGNGLARLDAPTGTLIAYSTAPGDVAVDGDGRHSPYAFALARQMRQKEIAAEQMFRNVRVRVLERTGQRQTPWESSSLTGAFHFNPESTPVATGGSGDGGDGAGQQTAVAESAPRSAASETDVELAFWQSVKESDTKAAYSLYLERYPEGTFADLARLRVAKKGGESSGNRSGNAAQQTQTAAVEPEAVVEEPEGGESGSGDSVTQIASIDPRDMAMRTTSNIRAAPTTKATKLATYPARKRVRVIGRAGGSLDWYVIEMEQGRRGFVYGDLVVPPEELPNTTPSREESPDPDVVARRKADIAGVWDGRFQCQNLAIGLRLTLRQGTGPVMGRADFFPLPGEASVPSGAYRVVGRYQPGSGSVSLKAGPWIDRPPGFQKHGFRGQIAPDGARLTGRVATTGCRRFLLERR